MPTVNARITAGCTDGQLSTLLEKATQAVVSTVAAPVSAVRITLTEISPDHTMVAGEIGTRIALFMVYLISGRTDEQKAALIGALSKAASESTGISDQEVRVIVRDVPATDMGMAGGVTARSLGR